MKKLKQQDRKHSRISPSKLKPLQICPGWENQEGESEASLRGTFLHEIMETGEIPKAVPEKVTEEDIAMAKQMLVFLREEEKLSPYEPVHEMELDFKPLGLEDFEKGHLDRVLILEVDKDENPTKAELTDFKFGEWEVEPVKDKYSDVADALQYAVLGLGEGRRLIGMDPTLRIKPMQTYRGRRSLRRV